MATTTRHTFTEPNHRTLANTVIVELLPHPTDPAKRTATVQFGDNVDTADIDVVVLHDHASNYIYEVSPLWGDLTAQTELAGKIILDYATEGQTPTPPTPPTTTPTTTTTAPTPPTSPTTRGKIGSVAASPFPPSQHLEELR